MTIKFDFILSLPTWVGCGVRMFTAAVIGLAVYFVSYNLISEYKSDDLKDPITSIFRVVGVLASLMLSLTFSEVIVEQRTIRDSIQREASSILDLFVIFPLSIYPGIAANGNSIGIFQKKLFPLGS